MNIDNMFILSYGNHTPGPPRIESVMLELLSPGPPGPCDTVTFGETCWTRIWLVLTLMLGL